MYMIGWFIGTVSKPPGTWSASLFLLAYLSFITLLATNKIEIKSYILSKRDKSPEMRIEFVSVIFFI